MRKRIQGEKLVIRHLALIMDGNRRWAKQRSLKPWLGHDAGTQAVREVIEFCLEQAIPYTSLYAFSLENFKRSPEEVTFLFDIFIREAEKQAPTLQEKDVRVRFIGDRELFPEHVKDSIASIEEKTAACATLTVNLLFCYGAQQELVAAVKTIAIKVQQGLLALKDISVQTVADMLWTAGVPDPELIIRTGGRQRLSNFLLYQAAYSELYFLDCLWPDIRKQHLDQALEQFKKEQRNFGT
jgi:undecaprenyl diphosphate synthase